MANFRIIIVTVILSVILYAFTKYDLKPRLVGFIASECNKDLDPYLLIDRIIQKELQGDSLYLTLGLKENCAQNFHPAVNFNNNRLEIILDNTPDTSDVTMMAFCDCCFELTLIMTGIKDTTFSVVIDGIEIPFTKHPYRTYPEQYEIYNGDTINRKNQYGLMEGVWFTFDENKQQVKSKEFYAGRYSLEDPVWQEIYSNGTIQYKKYRDTTWTFDENGAMYSKRVLHHQNEPYMLLWFEQSTYYPNGKIKSYCVPSKLVQTSLNFENLDSCRYWNEKGEEIKNKP